MKHLLKYSGFQLLNPFLMNRIKSGQEKGIVTSTTTIEFLGESLTIANPKEVQVTIGETVHVFLERHFYFQTKEEKEQQEEIRIQKRLAENERLRNESVQMRLQAEQFYEQYTIPFHWSIDYKYVASGLLENSYGDGLNRKSVTHLLALESFAIGRIKRKKGDFLCTTTSTDNGHFSELISVDTTYGRLQDEDGKAYYPVLTCKKCLKLLERWKK